MTVLIYHNKTSDTVKFSGHRPDLIFEVNFLGSLLIIRVCQCYVERGNEIVTRSVNKFLRCSDLQVAVEDEIDHLLDGWIVTDEGVGLCQCLMTSDFPGVQRSQQVEQVLVVTGVCSQILALLEVIHTDVKLLVSIVGPEENLPSDIIGGFKQSDLVQD